MTALAAQPNLAQKPYNHPIHQVKQHQGLSREISVSSSVQSGDSETTSSSVSTDDDDSRHSFNIFAAGSRSKMPSQSIGRMGGRNSNHIPAVSSSLRDGPDPGRNEADYDSHLRGGSGEAWGSDGHSVEQQERYSYGLNSFIGADEEHDSDEYQYNDNYHLYAHETGAVGSSEDYFPYPSFDRIYNGDEELTSVDQVHDEGEESEEDDAFLLQYGNNPTRPSDYEDILDGYDDEGSSINQNIDKSMIKEDHPARNIPPHSHPSHESLEELYEADNTRKRFSFEDEESYEYADTYDYRQPSPQFNVDDNEHALSVSEKDGWSDRNSYRNSGRRFRPSLPSLVTNQTESTSAVSKELSHMPPSTAPAPNYLPSTMKGISGNVTPSTAPAVIVGSMGPLAFRHVQGADPGPSAPLPVDYGSASVPTTPGAASATAFPSRGSSHVILQHLARTNSTARGGPSDKRAIREALAAAKKLTSSGHVMDGAAVLGGSSPNGSPSSSGASTPTGFPGSPSLPVRIQAKNASSPLVRLTVNLDDSEGRNGMIGDSIEDSAKGAVGALAIPVSAPSSSQQHVPFVSPTHTALSGEKMSGTSGGDIFSAPITLESSIPYSPLHLPSNPPASTSASSTSDRGAPPPHVSHQPITPESIEDLLEKGRRFLLYPQSAATATVSHPQSDSFESALACWKEAVRLSQQVGDSFREARALNNLGCAFRRAGRERESWDSLDRAWGLAVTALEVAISSNGEDPHEDGVGVNEGDGVAFVDSAPLDDADEDEDAQEVGDENEEDVEDEDGAARRRKRIDTREMARRRRLRRVITALQINTPSMKSAVNMAIPSRQNGRSNPKADAKKNQVPSSTAMKALKLLGVGGGSPDSLAGSGHRGAAIERSNSSAQNFGNGSGTLERMQTWSGGSRSIGQKKPSLPMLIDMDPNLMNIIQEVCMDKLGGALGFDPSSGSKPRSRGGLPKPPSSTGSERLRQVGPPIYVLCMDICTSIGNAHFARGKYLNAMTWHQSCLDLAQDAFVKWPLPVRAAEALAADLSQNHPSVRPEVSMKLSYLHRSAIIARSRSFSHLGLCLQRLGEPHRAVKFHHRAISSLNVAGPQTQLNAPHARASLVGNLAIAQFEVGRVPEAARGLADAVRRFAGCSDQVGLARARMNSAACWIESGRLGITVAIVTGASGEASLDATMARSKGDSKGDTSVPTASAAANLYVPVRKASIATMMSELGSSGPGNSNPPGFKTIQRAIAGSGPPGLETLRRVVSNVSSSTERGSVGPTYQISAPTGVTSSSASLRSMATSSASSTTLNNIFGWGSSSGVIIPPRLHSVPTVKEKSGNGGSILACLERAKKDGPEWLVDIVGALRMLSICVEESQAVRDVECEGLARFNIAAALILLKLPGRAAKVLTSFTRIDWYVLLSKGYSRRPGRSRATSAPGVVSWRGPEPTSAFFNLIQLLFVASLQYLDVVKSGGVWELPSLEMAAIQTLSKDVAKFVAPGFLSSPSASNSPPSSPISPQHLTHFGLSPVMTGRTRSNSGMSSSSIPPIDGGILISALKKCLEWFDGSALGPSTNQTPNLVLPGPKADFLSMTTSQAQSKREEKIGDAVPGSTPWSSLPRSSRPHGSTTTGTTRICLALSRTLVVIFSVQAAPRRVAMARDEARRWAGVEASVGLNNAATAAAASRRSRSRSTVVAGSGLDSLLISAVAETGEVHGTLALEVGAVACDLEEMASSNWVGGGTSTGALVEGNGTVHRLVRLAAKKVRLEVVRRVRDEEIRLDALLENFSIAN
ncbi:hypothetical protein HDU67_002538 [Dinochytrium kinnereticum]|nr:hypothetical protein HDU67_002538 [Dinochytrium kinnereticum]